MSKKRQTKRSCHGAKNGVPRVKKDIKKFLLEEEGKISKKNIAKLGVSLAALAAMFDSEFAEAAHASSYVDTGSGGHSSFHANHGNHGDCGYVSVL